MRRPTISVLALLLAACAADPPAAPPEVRATFDRIAGASEAYARGAWVKPVLVVSSEATVNATALGDTVTLHQGLLDYIGGDADQLAGVTGHEAAHVVLRHGETAPPYRDPSVEGEADIIGRCIADDAGFASDGLRRFLESLPGIPTDETFTRIERLREIPAREYCQ